MSKQKQHPLKYSMQAYFTWFVALALVWSIVATAIATTLPIIEAWRIMVIIFASLFPFIPGMKALAHRARQKGLQKEAATSADKVVAPDVDKPEVLFDVPT